MKSMTFYQFEALREVMKGPMTVKVLMTCNVQLYKTLQREFSSTAETSHFYVYCITKRILNLKINTI